jgi:hydroxylamine reductase
MSNFDDARMVAYIREADRMRTRAKALCTDQTPDAAADALDLKGDATALLARAKPLGVEARREQLGPDLNGLAEMAVYGLKGTCAYADHARQLGTERDSVYAGVHRTLALVSRSRDLNELVGVNMGVGAINFEVMQMLEDAHTHRFGHPVPTQVPTMPRPNAKAILVSGHDLYDLEDILKQSAGKGIDVYTHGEMLPAHGYPKLKAYKNLAGPYARRRNPPSRQSSPAHVRPASVLTPVCPVRALVLSC